MLPNTSEKIIIFSIKETIYLLLGCGYNAHGTAHSAKIYVYDM